MTESLARLLLRLSEAGEPAILWGRLAKPHLGREFDRLLTSGLLVEEAPATEWDICSACECGQHSRMIQEINDRFVATCPIDRGSDVILSVDDLRSFRINAAAIAVKIAAASGFVETPSQVMPGVWFLGTTRAKRSLFVAFARDGLLATAAIAALKAVEPKLPITIVGPPLEPAVLLRFVEAGVHFVATGDAFAAAGAPFALDAVALVPPAAIQPRLTLFRPRAKMAFDGAELELAPISFKLLWLLADRIVHGGGLVSRVEIERCVWATVVSKTAAADAVRNLRGALQTLAASGVGSLVRTVPTQGCILDLAASDIRLVD